MSAGVQTTVPLALGLLLEGAAPAANAGVSTTFPLVLGLLLESGGSGGPSDPTTVVGTPTGGVTATITWVDAGSGETGFQVQLAPTSTGTYADAAGDTNPTAADVQTFAATTLTAATEYTPRVRALGTPDSGWAYGATFTTDNTGSGGGEVTAILTGAAAVGILSTAGTIAINPATVLSGTALLSGLAAAGTLTGGAASVLGGTAVLGSLQAGGTITSAAPSTLLGTAALSGIVAGGSIVSLAPAVLSGAAALGQLAAAGTVTGGAASVLSGAAVLGRVISTGALQGLVSIDSAAPTGYYRRNARKIRSGQARSDGAEVMLAIGARRRR